MRGHPDYQAATWQLMPFTRCDGVYGLEGHAVQSGHIEHWPGGHARTIHHEGVCAWLQKSLAFQPHGIKQSRGMSGEGIWTTKRQPGSPCTSPDVMLFMGPSKDMLCKVAMLNIARTPHRGGWLQEEAGFSAARNQAEQRLVRRGHLDHHKGWRTRSHTSVKEFAAGFMKTLAFQLRAIKQNKGSSGLRSNVADSAVLT